MELPTVITGPTSPTMMNPRHLSEPIASSVTSGTMEVEMGPMALRTRSHIVKIVAASLLVVIVLWAILVITIDIFVS